MADLTPTLVLKLEITRVTYNVDKLDLSVTNGTHAGMIAKKYPPKLITAANTPALLSAIITLLDGAR